MCRPLVSLLAAFWLISARGTAAPAAAPSATVKPQPGSVAERQKVGGDYTVAAVDRIDDHTFRVEFAADHPTGHFDLLRLESDHVHVAVKVGQKLRLSAEILSTQGTVAEVSQVVLFLPGATGRVPVWLLSNKAPTPDLRATKYLEMHVPLTDYMVM